MQIAIDQKVVRNAKPSVLSPRTVSTAVRWWMWSLMESSTYAAICVTSVM